MKAVRQRRSEMDAVEGEMEGARRATGVSPSTASAPSAPGAETEVLARPERRRFSAEYKQRVLREADRCSRPGEIGALLRREGLYSSLLALWRAARDRGELEALSARKRGPKAPVADPRDRKLVELEREMVRWRKRAERAEALVEVQKKVAALLGAPLDDEKS